MEKYNGFDPLEKSITNIHEEIQIKLLNDAKKREIKNILKSYTGYYDIFSEMLQNALDATEKKWRIDKSYQAEIQIIIDFIENSICVIDNGQGMTKEEFEFCLFPNISFKENENLRGNKGVGATFLAYGYNHIEIYTKSKNFEASVKLNNGKRWVAQNDYSRPKFEDTKKPDFNYSEGTSFKIILEYHEKPRLRQIGATTPDQWYNVLRIKSPLGGVYLTTPEDKKFKPTYKIIVSDKKELKTTKIFPYADYYYPHEIPNIKIESISNIDSELAKLPGDYEEKFDKLSNQYKKLNAVFEIWDKDQLLNDSTAYSITNGITDDQKDQIAKHNVSVYGFFCNSTKIFDKFNDDTLKLKAGLRILKGGLQIASDGMPQGDLYTIPLTKMIGYQNQSHVIVHFEKGESDLGRKIFQPDNTELSLKLAVNVVNLLRKYRKNLKVDETADPLTPDRDRHEWIKEQEKYFESFPLRILSDHKNITILNLPQKEQDVVALFNQLIGVKLIKGFEIYATSEHTRYDSLIRLNYSNEDEFIFSENNKIGISDNTVQDYPYISEPKILEYKYDFDALIRETQNGEKYNEHIDLVVAWDATLKYQDKIELKSLLTDNQGKDQRRFYGSTHAAYMAGHYERPVYEVIILKDLLNFLIDSEKELFNQRRYDEC